MESERYGVGRGRGGLCNLEFRPAKKGGDDGWVGLGWVGGWGIDEEG